MLKIGKKRLAVLDRMDKDMNYCSATLDEVSRLSEKRGKKSKKKKGGGKLLRVKKEETKKGGKDRRGGPGAREIREVPNKVRIEK